jgi:hypothetical protein
MKDVVSRHVWGLPAIPPHAHPPARLYDRTDHASDQRGSSVMQRVQRSDQGVCYLFDIGKLILGAELVFRTANGNPFLPLTCGNAESPLIGADGRRDTAVDSVNDQFLCGAA